MSQIVNPRADKHNSNNPPKPKFKNLAEENPDIAFVYVDAEKFPESRRFADVSNLPTFASFTDGELVLQKQGNKIETIKDVLNAITTN